MVETTVYKALFDWWVACLTQTHEAEKAYLREWRKKNPENQREWQKNHPGYRKTRRLANLEDARKYEKKWAEENRDKCRAADRKSYKKHRIKRIAARTAWRTENIERDRATRRIWDKTRRQLNPATRLRQNLAVRVRKVLKGINKSKSTMELVGSSIDFLRAHLEKQFRPGMTWENYGPVWHVDHIKPCAKFDLTDPTQQKECFHFSNLQPLFALENILKGDK